MINVTKNILLILGLSVGTVSLDAMQVAPEDTVEGKLVLQTVSLSAVPGSPSVGVTAGRLGLNTRRAVQSLTASSGLVSIGLGSKFLWEKNKESDIYVFNKLCAQNEIQALESLILKPSSGVGKGTILQAQTQAQTSENKELSLALNNALNYLNADIDELSDLTRENTKLLQYIPRRLMEEALKCQPNHVTTLVTQFRFDDYVLVEVTKAVEKQRGKSRLANKEVFDDIIQTLFDACHDSKKQAKIAAELDLASVNAGLKKAEAHRQAYEAEKRARGKVTVKKVNVSAPSSSCYSPSCFDCWNHLCDYLSRLC